MLEAPASQPVLDGTFSDHHGPHPIRPTLVVVTSPAQTDEVPIASALASGGRLNCLPRSGRS